jgi:hypothetical protein
MEHRQAYLELIAVISHVLHGKELPEQIHWDQVISLAIQHKLMAFVYRAIAGRKNLPASLVSRVETIHFGATGEQMRQEHYATELFTALRQRGIRYMPMKGYLMRELYPNPAWRTSSDLEILCDEEHRGDVGQILAGYGFSRISLRPHTDVWALDHVVITIHTRIAEEKDPLGAYFSSVWEKLETDDGILYRMTDEDYCIYILHQMSKYIYLGRISIRQILDLYIYRHAKVDLNRAYVEAALEELGILKFTLGIERLCEVWFGDEEQTNDTMTLGSFIAANSAYGIAACTPVKFNIVFPSFKIMKYWYRILRPLPFLLPFVWVWRWGGMIFCPSFDRKRRAALRTADGRSAKMLAHVEEILGLASPGATQQ